MFAFLGIKDIAVAAKYLAILGAVVVVCAGLYYITGLRSDLAIAQANVVKLQSAISEQKLVIDQYKKDISAQQAINKDLQATTENQRKDINGLRKRFQAANLPSLTKVNPSAVEEKINRGTVHAVRCFEIASGSPLTERERNAKTAAEFNPECPSLWPGSKH